MRATNLFCFHDSSGKLDALGPLVSRMPAELRVFGLERRRGPARLWTLADLAADHLRRLRAVQSTGPWSLLGWSFGGVVAFEVARQLESEGQEVELLALLDSTAPRCQFYVDLFRQSLRTLNVPAERDVDADLEELERAVAALGTPFATTAAGLPASIRKAVPPAERSDPNLFPRAVATILDHVRLLTRYRPANPVAPRRTVCVVASDSGPSDGEEWAGWVRNPVIYREVLGDHRSILQAPAVEQTAGAINRALFGPN